MRQIHRRIRHERIVQIVLAAFDNENGQGRVGLGETACNDASCGTPLRKLSVAG